ncbi:glutamate--cysteine ligase [Streptomyces sp. BE20]|uniref:carboxylate-amine ligase n=1 Tax=Streptomyces sp. BE20 TaxID=3002525 RepID=UPI002E79ADBD|nr:glutamate--cysteine ligase [Streptomyces sp. BE20]MEE1825008.1 glutamate--cysteine ligase [Streptomyces sp. BE20]
MLTLGVEEEYLLIDPRDATPVPRAAEVLAAADLAPALRPDEAQHELLQVQVETATPVCEDLAAVSRHLVRIRAGLSAAAARNGCRVVPVGAAPFGHDGPVPVTDGDRYRRARRQAPSLVDDLMLNGMHVHVGIPDPEERLGALVRLRPWLPVVVAMAANSPYWRDRDTHFASWRTVQFDQWAVSGPPPLFRDAADHRRRVDALLTAGAITDEGQVYWHARLSARYPTVEVRAADVQLTVADAELFAGLIRALVTSAVLDERAGRPRPETPDELVRAATWHAAHAGLHGALISPLDGVARPTAAVIEELWARIAPGLDAAGDTDRVSDLWQAFRQNGNGADRQRRWYREAGRTGLAEHLIGSTLVPAP